MHATWCELTPTPQPTACANVKQNLGHVVISDQATSDAVGLCCAASLTEGVRANSIWPLKKEIGSSHDNQGPREENGHIIHTPC